MHLRLDRVWDKKLNMISEYRDSFGRRVFLFRLGKNELPPYCFSILHQIISLESVPFLGISSFLQNQFFFRINPFLQNQFLSSESVPYFRISSFLQNQFLSSESIPLFRISSFLRNQFLSSESISFFRINFFF
jgi:hypothetical protein